MRRPPGSRKRAALGSIRSIGSIDYEASEVISIGGNRQFGRSVSAAGDVNEDGLDDLLVTNRRERVFAVSGDDGSVLRSLPGHDVHPIGDADADGFADFAVHTAASLPADEAVVGYSGRTGGVLWTVLKEEIPGSTSSDRQLVSAGDVNGDGATDVLLTYETDDFRREARIFSGRNGRLLRTHTSASPIAFARPLGDLNADGFDDYGFALSDHTGSML